MAKKSKDVHAGGRPEKYDKAFYLEVLRDYENHSYSQLAELRNVSVGTVVRWVKKGRELNEEANK